MESRHERQVLICRAVFLTLSPFHLRNLSTQASLQNFSCKKKKQSTEVTKKQQRRNSNIFLRPFTCLSVRDFCFLNMSITESILFLSSSSVLPIPAPPWEFKLKQPSEQSAGMKQWVADKLAYMIITRRSDDFSQFLFRFPSRVLQIFNGSDHLSSLFIFLYSK